MTAMPPISRHQRAVGEARAGFVLRNGRARLRDLRQAGSAKAIVLDGSEVVFLNTSGGLTGGDRLSYALDLGDGCRALATTQTAERVYRAGEGRARIAVNHRVGDGGHLDWLPQETILFDGAAAERRTEIALGAGASCLTLETVVLGRAAMGETVRRVWFRDARMITRQGRPVMAEPLLLDDAALVAGSAVLDGALAFASLVMVGQGAEDALSTARATLDEPGVRGGASGLDGRLVVRLMAVEGWALRRQLARLLVALRRAPLPRVWQMQESMA